MDTNHSLITFVHTVMKKSSAYLILVLGCCLLFFYAPAQIIIQPQRVSNNPEAKLPETLVTDGNIFVKVVLSKTNCVVNEPVLATYKFYTRLNGQSKVSELPTFTGCSVQEMTTENTFPEMEEVNGKTFKSYIIRKVQLYPLHAGDIVLGAASVENVFSLYNKGTTINDIRNGTATTQNKTIVVSNQPVAIHVADFPEKDKPADFDGAVGTFTIKAMVNKTNDTANENNSLQILIEGEGSFQNIVCPNITWPKNIEAFEATTTEMVNKVTYPASGAKVFDVPFIAKAKGKLTLPPISFSFYDMQTHAYKTVHTDVITINVTEAKASNIDLTKIHENITNFKYIWIVPVLALIVGISLWFRYGFDKKKGPKQMVAEADEMIEATIGEQQEVETVKEDTDAEKLNRLLLSENDEQFFGQAKALSLELLAKETYANHVNLLNQLLSECNAALYGAANVSKDDVLRRLEEIIL